MNPTVLNGRSPTVFALWLILLNNENEIPRVSSP